MLNTAEQTHEAVGETLKRSAKNKRNLMKSLSMPDLTELKDIQSFDEALFFDDDSSKNDLASAVSLSSSLLSPASSAADLIALASKAVSRYYPMRVFSLGLHRSMSLPKETATHEEEESHGAIPQDGDMQEEDDNDFFMPFDQDGTASSNDDDGEGTEQSSGYLPRFYSAEKLGTLIPPQTGNSRKKLSRPVQHTQKQNVAEKPRDESSMDRQGQPPLQDLSSSSNSRDVALSNLADFFLGDAQEEDPTYPSPNSVTNLQWPRQRERLESNHLDDCQKSATFDSVNRRSIFGNKAQTTGTPTEPCLPVTKEPAPSEHADNVFEGKHFEMLHRDDRANSLPMKMPSSRSFLSSSPSTGLLPRRSSLKKVSSYNNFKNNASENASVSSSSMGGMKQNVSFSNLSIREYEVTLGDNPSCSMGPPISLGWEYRDAAVVSLDDYETTRSLHFPRRNSSQLLLSYNVRRYLLLKTAGYTKAELRQAMKEVERVKRERKVTDLLMPACMLDEVMEDVVERVKSMFGNEQGNKTCDTSCPS